MFPLTYVLRTIIFVFYLYFFVMCSAVSMQCSQQQHLLSLMWERVDNTIQGQPKNMKIIFLKYKKILSKDENLSETKRIFSYLGRRKYFVVTQCNHLLTNMLGTFLTFSQRGISLQYIRVVCKNECFISHKRQEDVECSETQEYAKIERYLSGHPFCQHFFKSKIKKVFLSCTLSQSFPNT